MNHQVATGIRKSMEPWIKDEVEFYEHQITGIRQMMQMRNLLLADDMGLGKSLQAQTVAAGDIIRGWAEKILVVAPITLKSNWSDEFDKFTGIPHIILGQTIDPKNPERMRPLSPAKRTAQIDEFAAMSGPRALIANYEQIVKHHTQLNRIGFHIIIFDEAHFLKNPRAQRTKACHKLKSNRYFLLTGTPMLNQVDELWSLLHIIDPAGYPNYFTFRNRYCVFGGWQDKQIIGVKNEKELQDRLKAIMIRRLKSDVLDLPEVQYIIKKVDLSEEQRRIYDKAESELEIEMRIGLNDPSVRSRTLSSSY
jgi:SNF2 family DNA or RNA helicase